MAIIAILALIAVPNFLEAQTRAKISRVKTDMRTVATAIEAYAVDYNVYPICQGRQAGSKGSGGVHHLTPLTTPVSFLTSVSYRDPFKPTLATDNEGWLIGDSGNPYSYGYASIQWLQQQLNYPPHTSMWVMVSNGPDFDKGPHPDTGAAFWYQYYGDVRVDTVTKGKFTRWNYDPTNGTVSSGDIIRWQTGVGN